MKNTRTIERKIEGITFIFTRTRTIKPWLKTKKITYTWVYGKKGDAVLDIEVQGKSSGIRRSLPHLVKYATMGNI